MPMMGKKALKLLLPVSQHIYKLAITESWVKVRHSIRATDAG